MLMYSNCFAHLYPVSLGGPGPRPIAFLRLRIYIDHPRPPQSNTCREPKSTPASPSNYVRARKQALLRVHGWNGQGPETHPCERTACLSCAPFFLNGPIAP